MTRNGGPSNGSSSSEESLRLDLSNRYQETIEVQAVSIQNFDTKTWRTIRATGIIAGASVGGLSLITKQTDGGILSGLDIQIALTIASISFITAFALGIRSYQSSKFSTPPWVEIGRRIHKTETDFSDYENSILISYANAIDSNRQTLKTKRERFRQTLFMLLFGLWNVGIAAVFIVWDPKPAIGYPAIPVGELLGFVIALGVLYGQDVRTKEESEGNSD